MEIVHKNGKYAVHKRVFKRGHSDDLHTRYAIVETRWLTPRSKSQVEVSSVDEAYRGGTGRDEAIKRCDEFASGKRFTVELRG